MDCLELCHFFAEGVNQVRVRLHDHGADCLIHTTDLRIEDHYTDTTGFTDHVFALIHLFGFRFAPRIRNLGSTKFYITKGHVAYSALKPMTGITLNIKHVRTNGGKILRLATSIK